MTVAASGRWPLEATMEFRSLPNGRRIVSLPSTLTWSTRLWQYQQAPTALPPSSTVSGAVSTRSSASPGTGTRWKSTWPHGCARKNMSHTSGTEGGLPGGNSGAVKDMILPAKQTLQMSLPHRRRMAGCSSSGAAEATPVPQFRRRHSLVDTVQHGHQLSQPLFNDGKRI
ncbi:hypothetical protein VTI74DRAFT_10253 [Chaetomium olivicolor]